MPATPQGPGPGGSGRIHANGEIGVPGNATQAGGFASNLFTSQGANLVTNAAGVTQELPAPVLAALVQAGQPEADQRNLLVCAPLSGLAKKSTICPARKGRN
jgi:hypothetical protein